VTLLALESFLSKPERPEASSSRVHPPAKEHERELVLLVTLSAEFKEAEISA